jgi:hypothetical protein
MRVIPHAVPAIGIDGALGYHVFADAAFAQAPDDGANGGAFGIRAADASDDFVVRGGCVGDEDAGCRRQPARDAELDGFGPSVRIQRTHVRHNLVSACEHAQFDIDEAVLVGHAASGERATKEAGVVTFTGGDETCVRTAGVPQLHTQAAESNSTLGVCQEAAHRERVGRAHRSVSTPSPAS